MDGTTKVERGGDGVGMVVVVDEDKVLLCFFDREDDEDDDDRFLGEDTGVATTTNPSTSVSFPTSTKDEWEEDSVFLGRCLFLGGTYDG